MFVAQIILFKCKLSFLHEAWVLQGLCCCRHTTIGVSQTLHLGEPNDVRTKYTNVSYALRTICEADPFYSASSLMNGIVVVA